MKRFFKNTLKLIVLFISLLSISILFIPFVTLCFFKEKVKNKLLHKVIDNILSLVDRYFEFLDKACGD